MWSIYLFQLYCLEPEAAEQPNIGDALRAVTILKKIVFLSDLIDENNKKILLTLEKKIENEFIKEKSRQGKITDFFKAQ